ncbi:hypothetical protein NQ023_07400 [Corynebacterium phoceense]|uniref:hypothetical protein n=1 Tax=Corynebacterium phoceense TaxID=1686286 RepID=UPI00211C9623|nr:hypothetical protein [Corynebacterium phoceense]MCQ9331363.1 hypothetical protein [Corynebacterium phoceense]MCQ9348290.1 hypothetical protein [Corynebacterium phoceense]
MNKNFICKEFLDKLPNNVKVARTCGLIGVHVVIAMWMSLIPLIDGDAVRTWLVIGAGMVGLGATAALFLMYSPLCEGPEKGSVSRAAAERQLRVLLVLSIFAGMVEDYSPDSFWLGMVVAAVEGATG